MRIDSRMEPSGRPLRSSKEVPGAELSARAGTSPAPTGPRYLVLPILFGVLVATMGGFGAHGDEDARELEGLLGSMSSYRGDFEQVVAGQYGEVLQTSTGTIHIERPRKLRWQVDEPYPQLVVADGSHVWVFDPDLEQVTVHRFDETVEGTPAMFLTDTALLDENFLVGTADAMDGSERRFTLAPRDPDSSSLFRTVTLAFSSEGLLAGLEIVDHLEQRASMSVRNGELNPVLESELFQFDVPEGVDVIGNLPDDVPAESTP